MRFILLALFLAAAPVSRAQTPPGEENKDIKQQSEVELKKTASDLEEAVRQHPEKVELHIRLGFTYTKLGKIDEARKSFETTIKLDPKKAIAHYMLGLIYEKKGLRAQAVAAMKACRDNAADPLLREKASVHLHRLSSEGAQ